MAMPRPPGLRWLAALANAFVFTAFTMSTPPAAAQARNDALHRLFADAWERRLHDEPEWASYQGDHRHDERWTDWSPDAVAARLVAERDTLARARAVDRGALSPADLLHLDTFVWQLQRSVERQRFREWLMPISHQGGVQTADTISELMPFRTAADYRRWTARLRGVPRLVDQTIALLRQGMAEGRMPPRVLMQRVPAQIEAQLVADATASPFYRPFLRIPATLPEAAALQAEAQALIREELVPAYRRLQRVFLDEYLPRTRSGVAVSELPDGRAYYELLAGWYTTTGLTADEIHAIGLREVARIRGEMQKVQARIGFEGPLEAFLQHLRTDPRYFATTPQELLRTYRDVAKRIDPELTKVLRTLPRLPYGVRPIPDTLAPNTTTAYYQGGAIDGSRPGYYVVNLYKPESRPTWEIVPLTLHEAVPGHHLQFALALEMPDAPAFRRTAYFVAYGEGWALYAEQLGHEMGLYENPLDHFGQLVYEMWRAVRLVVDTGLHVKGWTREQAIDYFRANAGRAEQDTVNEIDRYIDWPGQALAYKIGQLRISALRSRAEASLGTRFDLRDFNDAVLATGSVPLAVLEAHIDGWIAARAAAPR
jgi:uncharacterized protein (DUF885 family)